jgi:erythronate-4-phosphate dehydrogenase
VWENEPEIDVALLRLVEIGTPHIAGYSLDGKLNGTNQIYHAACEFLGVTPQWQMSKTLPAIAEPEIRLAENFETSEKKLDALIKRVYDITADAQRLRASLRMNASDRARHFDRLRKEYPIRRDFHNYLVDCGMPEKNMAPPIRTLGFQVLNDNELKVQELVSDSH